MADHQSLFEAYLNQHDDAAWEQVIDQVWSAIHPVDQRATRIWFAFFPLKLKRALEAAPDPAKLERDLILQGAWKLGDQVDGSAHFLYGHRYWPQVKQAVVEDRSVTGSSFQQDGDTPSRTLRKAGKPGKKRCG